MDGEYGVLHDITPARHKQNVQKAYIHIHTPLSFITDGRCVDAGGGGDIVHRVEFTFKIQPWHTITKQRESTSVSNLPTGTFT